MLHRSGVRGAGALLRRGMPAVHLPRHVAAIHSARSNFETVENCPGQQKSSAAWEATWTKHAKASNRAVALPMQAAAMEARADPKWNGVGAAAHFEHGGNMFVVMPMEQAVPTVPTLVQQSGILDWRSARQEQESSASVTGVSVSIGDALKDLLGKLDLDGEVEWEEMQAGSVMKKRKKAMNKHKWKKRRKRDRSYAR